MTGANKCHSNAKCINTIGSYDCICNKGFSGDGFNCNGMQAFKHAIFNVFILLNNLTAKLSVICHNKLILVCHFLCSLIIGRGMFCMLSCFFLIDVNECKDIGACDKNARCINTAGAYQCTCNDGFSGNGFKCVGERSVKNHCL